MVFKFSSGFSPHSYIKYQGHKIMNTITTYIDNIPYQWEHPKMEENTFLFPVDRKLPQGLLKIDILGRRSVTMTSKNNGTQKQRHFNLIRVTQPNIKIGEHEVAAISFGRQVFWYLPIKYEYPHYAHTCNNCKKPHALSLIGRPFWAYLRSKQLFLLFKLFEKPRQSEHVGKNKRTS
jgi:hypothetical protein